ncbi:DICT sensory domain-containing protein [Halotia branconii]|uniref:histidine kinase n=1 Tax=Halotia branconii CENA392 TaxID=1539056 RepID=A0AAJ6NMV8_9CYAN|nr:DICT sensory domain-containing protein [Halotia branconii]WGV23331.1 DICT sensory domain-containing protein [Halotia branconii CENA392]
MNDSPRQDLSFYQLALGVEASPQPLPLNPATLLSLVRSQIDLLIEQQIVATFWVKLPPGKIWRTELVRYQSSLGASATIYNCQVGERRISKSKEVENLSPPPRSVQSGSRSHPGQWENMQEELTSPLHDIRVQLLPQRQIRREYFLLVLSPQFCSLILAHRPLKRRQTQVFKKVNSKKTSSLLTITTTEGKVVQQVLNGIKQAINLEFSSVIKPTDLICSSISKPAIINQLLIKQLQRQDEISRQNKTVQINKMQQQNQKLRHQDQLKDKYLSNVCQEMRTPLTHMKTALSLLNSPTLKPPQRQRYLQMLNNQCDRQSTLITGLLDMVDLEHNLDKTTLELVNLADVVPGVVSTYQPVAKEKGITLAYIVSTELPLVWSVVGRLRQIVINLLHNSVKFTPNGGQVLVKAHVRGDYVQLEFRDTGIGIAESEIPKIFDCFYRVRSGVSEDLGGAGLGLTIVKRLLWRCGGSIYVKSKPDEGSTFIVQLVSARNITQAIATE